MKKPETMTRAEAVEYIGNLKSMIRSLQSEIRRISKAPDCPVCKYLAPVEKNGNMVCIKRGAAAGTVLTERN